MEGIGNKQFQTEVEDRREGSLEIRDNSVNSQFPGKHNRVAWDDRHWSTHLKQIFDASLAIVLDVIMSCARIFTSRLSRVVFSVGHTI